MCVATIVQGSSEFESQSHAMLMYMAMGRHEECHCVLCQNANRSMTDYVDSFVAVLGGLNQSPCCSIHNRLTVPHKLLSKAALLGLTFCGVFIAYPHVFKVPVKQAIPFS